MSLLLNIPQHLSVIILRDWLGAPRNISALDVAYCSHVLFGVFNGNGFLWKRYLRLEFLHLLRDPQFSLLPEVRVSKAHVATFVAWINSRQISISSVVINISKLKEIAAIKPLDLPTLHTMRFRDESKQHEIRLSDMKVLLNGCQSLTHLDCAAWSHVTDDQLAMLASHPSIPMQVLTLSGCYKLTDKGLGKVVSQYRHTLKALYLDCLNITDLSLRTIAETCKGINKVSLSYCQGITRAGLTAFCANYPTLSEIFLEDMLPTQVSDDMLEELLKNSHGLHTLGLDYCKGVSIQALPLLLSICPSIRNLVTKDFAFYQQKRGLEMYRKLKLKGCYTRQHILMSMLQTCPVSIQEIDAKECRKLGGEILSMIGEKFGRELRSLQVSPWVDVADEVMVEVIAQCPLLQELSVDFCEALGDSTLSAIASHCPKLTSLSITKCPKITDEGVISLLEKCRHLQFLDVTACRHITDRVLDSLVEHCKEMKELIVLCTSVSDHGLLKLMLEDSLALNKLFIDQKFTSRINQQLGALGFFGSKWKRRLCFVNYFADPQY